MMDIASLLTEIQEGPLSALVLSNSVIFGPGVASLLRTIGFSRVSVSSSHDDLSSQVESGNPDLCVVCDWGAEEGEPLRDVIFEIRESTPPPPCVVITNDFDAEVAALLCDGSRGAGSGAGYVSLRGVRSHASFASSLARVLNGEQVIDASLFGGSVPAQVVNPPSTRLTERESETLAHIANGLSNVAIAKRMHISTGAVEKHVRAVFEKLDLEKSPDSHRRVKAVLAFMSMY